MTTAVAARPVDLAAGNGGMPARRAVVRWAWRMFRREWRQQLLILALIVVAVGATGVAATVATDTPTPVAATFGTAQDLATFRGTGPQVTAAIDALRQRFGRLDVIDNQTLSIPGSVDTYDLRAQDPHGAYGQPMLSLVSGAYPAGADQVALTAGVASALHLTTGDVWRQGGVARRVTGIVRNPLNLVDEFALVAPGQVTAPSQVTVLFDAPGVDPATLGPTVRARAMFANNINAVTISLAADTLGMLLIALVAVGGFTVLAQRRLRAIGLLGAVGATDRHIRLVVRANGAVVGAVGTLLGAVAGLAVWLAIRPEVQASAHHVIGVFQIPWTVVVIAMVLAVVATYLAALRPARAISRVPVVAALSGRPPAPRRVRHWTVPAGIAFLVASFVLLGVSGGSDVAGAGGQAQGERMLVLGFVLLIVAVVLLAPLGLVAVARLGRRAPVAVRLALRDLVRYRARSGSALAAISVGVFIAVVICVVSAARFANVLDFVGPNLAANQVIVYTPAGPYGEFVPQGKGGGTPPAPADPAAMASAAQAIGTALGAGGEVQLETTSASLLRAASGRNWSGPVYVATPQLLAAYGIRASQIDPAADILTMRPGLSTMSHMLLVYGGYFGGSGPGGGQGGAFACPASDCLANPVIQQVNALPPGTSAPNTVITENAVRRLGLQVVTAGWLIQAAHPPAAAQINSARVTAAAAGLQVETKSSIPSLGTIIDLATLFGIALALAILAMSVGLVRGETARDLRTLTAAGAGGGARRTITATTAGALALVGAVLGIAAGYVAAIAWFRTNALNGGLSALTAVPVTNLLFILIGMPLIAVVAGWLLAGREPRGIATRPLE